MINACHRPFTALLQLRRKFTSSLVIEEEILARPASGAGCALSLGFVRHPSLQEMPALFIGTTLPLLVLQ